MVEEQIFSRISVQAFLDRPGQTIIRLGYRIHGVDVAVTCNNAEVAQAIDKFLYWAPHLTSAETAQATAECFVLVTGSSANFPVTLPMEAARGARMRILPGSLITKYQYSDMRYDVFTPLEGINGAALNAMSTSSPVGVSMVDDPVLFAPWFIPRFVFFLSLGRVLRLYGFLPMHAASVDFNGRGALLLGEPGSGKTTLSFNCVRAGSGFLADDLTFVRKTPDGVHGYALPKDIAVRPGTREMFPELHYLKNLPPDKRGKDHVLVEDLYPGQVCHETPLRLLVFPHVVDAPESMAVRLSKAEVMRDLLVYSVDRADAGSQKTYDYFDILGELLTRCDCYRFDLGCDLEAGPQLVKGLLWGVQPDQDGHLTARDCLWALRDLDNAVGDRSAR